MRVTALLLAAAVGLLPAAARAQSGCRVEVDPLNFDRYNSFDPQPRQAAGQIRVRCTLGPPVQHVELSTGQGSDFHRRILSSGAGTLDYNIYTDSSRLHIAGDGTAGTAVLASRSRTRDLRPLQTFVIYGEIPAGQFQPPGDYVDSVRVTVVF